MSLPKIDLPKYKHYLNGLGKKVTYRPFTNKEQKVLLLAKEEGDKDQIVDAVKQILELCIVDKIDIDSLASFDIEDMFLRIRSKSVGEKVSPVYEYKYEDENGETKEDRIVMNIDLDNVGVKFPDNVNDIIKLNDQYSIKLKYPTFNDVYRAEGKTDYDKQQSIIMSCIESVFTEEDVYLVEDESEEEKQDFYDSLESKIMIKIIDFFESIPKLYHEVKVKRKDGKDKTIVFEGIESFFI